jgi:hypothetical protein
MEMANSTRKNALPAKNYRNSSAHNLAVGKAGPAVGEADLTVKAAPVVVQVKAAPVVVQVKAAPVVVQVKAAPVVVQVKAAPVVVQVKVAICAS